MWASCENCHRINYGPEDLKKEGFKLSLTEVGRKMKRSKKGDRQEQIFCLWLLFLTYVM